MSNEIQIKRGQSANFDQVELCLLYTSATNEDFRNSMLELWAALKDFLVKTLNNFRELFAATWDAIKLVFDAFAKLFRGDFSGFLNGMVQLITQAIPKMIEAGKNLFNGMWDGMKQIWESLKGLSLIHI